MLKRLIWLIGLLVVLLILSGCSNNFYTSQPRQLSEKEHVESTEISKVDNIRLLELTKEEQEIYNKFAASYDDEVLRDLSPITICKLYLETGRIGDYETEYELYIQDEAYLGWSKEEHMKIPKKHRMRDWSIFEKVNEITLTYFNDRNEATVSWESNNPQNTDADGNPFIYSFRLVKNQDGIWKVGFLPMQ